MYTYFILVNVSLPYFMIFEIILNGRHHPFYQLSFYEGKNSNLIETLPDFANMITDSIFLSPDQKVAELYSQYVPVFNYR